MSYNREEIREFFAKFWSDPENVKAFQKKQAESTIGKFDKFGRRYVTREEHEELCRELGMPTLEFKVS